MIKFPVKMLKTIALCALLLIPILSAVAVETLVNADDLKKFVGLADVVVLGYFENANNKKANVFREVATRIDGLSFGISVEESVKKWLKLEGEGVLLLKNFDEGKSVFEDEFDPEAMRLWIEANRRPLVGHYSEKARSRLFGRQIKAYSILFSKDQFDFARINRQFKAAAKQFKGKVGFIYVDTDLQDSVRIMKAFGITGHDAPAIRIVSFDEAITKFKPDFKEGFSGLSTENIVAFVRSHLDGSLKGDSMSKEFPESFYRDVFGNNKKGVTKTEL